MHLLPYRNVDYTILAFDKAEEYRTPVIILSDGAIGQMAESVKLPEGKEHDPNKFEWTLKGKDDTYPNGRKMTDGFTMTLNIQSMIPISATVILSWRRMNKCGRKWRPRMRRLFL